MSEEFGWCDLHEDSIDEETYRWKGCWGCHHFCEGEDYPYMSVGEAGFELGVSESTVRRWIKVGKLEGELFEQGRYTGYTGFLPSPKKYHIRIESVKNLQKKMS